MKKEEGANEDGRKREMMDDSLEMQKKKKGRGQREFTQTQAIDIQPVNKIMQQQNWQTFGH